MRKEGFRKGFTLVELALSIVFISVLSLTIVLIINNTIITYRRGLTLNEINTAGIDVSDGLKTSIQNSPSIDIGSMNDSLIVKKIGESTIFGLYCNGYESFVWNSGYLFNDNEIKDDDGGRINNKSEYGVFVGGVQVKLAKFGDKNRTICNEYNESDKYEITVEDELGSMEEIIPAENKVALYDLSVEGPAVGASSFYMVSFVLGSTNGKIVDDAGVYSCDKDNITYCAINKFKFAALATGG